MATREAYVGEKRKEIREGFGIYHYENKFFRYEGEWENGKKHGHGKLQMADGSYYEGEFQNGEITGHGYKYYASSGNSYSGQFLMGECHGQGVMNYSNGAMYEGKWNQNVRQGYGLLKYSDNSVYQGYLHDNKRHGEGTQVYCNGDRYDGDWVCDMRQGHGEMRFADGTLYDGQWRNDAFNGQGSIVHSSGVTYEGIWINGLPENMGKSVVFKDVESPLEITQGTPFTLGVITVNDEGVFVEEHGRDLHITAGYKYTAPREKSVSTESTSVGLFDMIEDVEEKPVETPFGYSIVSYPLTDSINVDDLASEISNMGLGRGRTDLSETVLPENEAVDMVSQGSKVFGPDSNQDSRKVPDVEEITPAVAAEDTVVTENTSSDLQAQTQALEGSALPPPVPNQTTNQGSVTFKNLTLPAAPPMYRPYVIAELEEERKESRASRSKLSSRQSKRDDDPDSRPSTKAKKLGDERFSRPAGKSNTKPNHATEATPEPPVMPKPELERVIPNLHAEPGEYVIMVADRTDPPFLGYTMKSAFLQVRVILPKKLKRRTTGKQSGPKWDTSQHITESAYDSQLAATAEDAELFN